MALSYSGNLINVLNDCQNPDINTRGRAENDLNTLRSQNYPAYLSGLSQVLAGIDSANDQTRSAAGLVLKNCLTAKETKDRDRLGQAWLQVDVASRTGIKGCAIHALQAPSKGVHGAAAQLVAYIGAIELPNQQWPDLIDTLVKLAAQPVSPVHKQAVLECLGYVCQEIEPTVLTLQSNSILTAVCDGIQDPNTEVTIEACKAMLNALDFVKSNFEKEAERGYIMSVLSKSAVHSNDRVKTISMECFVSVASLYYDKLAAYMQHIFQITLETIKSGPKEASLQAIEFWSTICEQETNFKLDAEEGDYEDTHSKHYVRGSLAFLVPLLMQGLPRREDDDDEDWNVSTASATCLALITTTVDSEIVPFVLPYVEQNIASQSWQLREAATLAFGAILEAPRNTLQAPIIAALPLLLTHMKDPQEEVKDTTAWTIARVCQLHGNIVATGLDLVMTTLISSLPDPSSKVASHVCYAIHNLMDIYTPDSNKSTSPISQYYMLALQHLISATERPDGDEDNLRVSAYETIAVLIASGAMDTLPTMKAAIPHFIGKFEQTLTTKAGGDTRIELQTLLCGVLQAVIRRFSAAELFSTDPTHGFIYADKFMELFLRVPSSHEAPTAAHEDALLSIAALTTSLEMQFIKYVPHTMPFVTQGLRCIQDKALCEVAVGLVGDVCRAVTTGILPFTEEIITVLLQNLQNSDIDRNVKPPIICTLGDIALAIGKEYERFLPVVLNMLNQAGQVRVDPNNYDLVDYQNQLREALCEAYTGIIIGMREGGTDFRSLMPYAPHIFDWIGFVWSDGTRTDSLNKGIIGIIGDSLNGFGNMIPKEYAAKLKPIIVECLKYDDEDIQNTAKWSADTFKKTFGTL